MKKKFYPLCWLYIIVIGMMVLSSSCQKEELDIPIYEPGSMLFGSASGKKAHLDWNASGLALRNRDGKPIWGILFGTQSSEGFLRESLSLGSIPYGTGTYELAREPKDGFLTSTYGTSQDDGDVGEDNYLLDESASGNTAHITKLDTIEKIIEGVFTASFQIADPSQKVNPNNPDKVTFSEVSFSVQIFE